MVDEQMYKMFIRYGTILKCDEYYTDDGDYLSVKLIRIDDNSALFALRNGNVELAEYVEQG